MICRPNATDEVRDTPMISKLFRIAAACLLLALLGLALPGCRTPDDGNMPWNTPQSWEGNPQIPGMTQD